LYENPTDDIGHRYLIVARWLCWLNAEAGITACREPIAASDTDDP